MSAPKDQTSTAGPYGGSPLPRARTTSGAIHRGVPTHASQPKPRPACVTLWEYATLKSQSLTRGGEAVTSTSTLLACVCGAHPPQPHTTAVQSEPRYSIAR